MPLYVDVCVCHCVSEAASVRPTPKSEVFLCMTAGLLFLFSFAHTHIENAQVKPYCTVIR